MTTQVTKVFKLGGTVGVDCDFNTDAARRAYITGLTCVASDINVKMVCYSNVTLGTNEGPSTYDATRLVTYVPAAGMGVNDLNRTTLDIGATGIALNVPRATGVSCNTLGIAWFGFRVLITGTGTNAAMLCNQDFAYNRIYDTSTGASTTEGVIKMSGGRVYRNLGVMEGVSGKVLFYDGGYTIPYFSNTWVGRGVALNAATPIKAEYAAGSTVINDAFIGCGSSLLIPGNNLVATNCYSNTTPTVGRTTGITVVTAAGGLVVNEASNYFPSATGGLIGTATAAADTTLDILGNNSGSDPDVGAVERDPVAALAVPDATITSIVQSGRRVTVTATFTSTATSGQITLVPSGTPNGAVSVNMAATINGSTATAVFDLVHPGNYSNASVIMSNQSGPGTSSGGNTFTVAAPAVPTVMILTQTKSRRSVTITGTYTGISPYEPISGTAAITAAGTPNGAVSKTGITVTLNSDGTFSATILSLNYGDYASTAIAITNYSGTGTATGAAVQLISPALPIGSVLTDISFQNETGSAQTNVPVTFGQVFKEGDFPVSGAYVSLRAPDDSIVLCQLDIKSQHSDASVRHAILSAILPTLAANSTVTYQILRAASGPAGAAAVPSDFSGLTGVVLLTDTGTDISGPTSPVSYTADAAAQLAAGTYETWLSGPICSEWILSVPLKTAGNAEHPDLRARFSIRAYKGQAKARIDYIVENNWAKVKAVASGVTPWENVSISDKVYRFSLKAGTTTVLTRAVKGKITTKLSGANGTFDQVATPLANNSTSYTATITVDGVAKAIAITGSAAQTYGALKTLINTQLGGAATCVSDSTNLGLLFESTTTGASSSVVITYGTLFPALGHITPFRPIYGDEVVHYARTRWKKSAWWGTAPSVHIAHNKTYLIASGAVPNYKASLTGSSTTIASKAAELALNEDIGQNGITKAYMGDVGYAPGIGILPEWAALYLVNQGSVAKNTMLKQADLGGSWPFHFRDSVTDRPISFADWPYATISPNAGDSTNPGTSLQEKLPDNVPATTLPANPNLPDCAHHPDFFFLPYMVTGDYYYMEGLLFYQRFIAIQNNPHATWRDGRKGLWFKEQSRGIAWALRTTMHAQYIVPTTHPLKSDIEYQSAANLTWFTTNYLSGTGFANALGVINHLPYAGLAYTGYGGVANTALAPWQDNFITAASGRAVELGYSEFLPLLTYKSKFPVGLLTSGTAFCWQLAGAYNVTVTNTAYGTLFNTFGEVYQASFSAGVLAAQCGSQAMTTAMTYLEGSRQTLNSMSGYPDLILGYPSNLQPAVAYSATYDVQGGDDAWTVFEGRSLKPDYNTAPQFAIEPRATVVDVVPDPDVTAPTLTGVLTESLVTTTSFTVTCPAATDAVGVAGYEYSIDGSGYAANSSGTSHSFTGKTPGTGYSISMRAFDAAGNRSAALTKTVTTVPITSVTLSLVSNAGASVGALTGLKWAWFDQATPDLFGAPTDKGAVELTNSSGLLSIDLPNSTKTTGQVGWLIVTNSDGTTGMVHKAFSGPVAVN